MRHSPLVCRSAGALAALLFAARANAEAPAAPDVGALTGVALGSSPAALLAAARAANVDCPAAPASAGALRDRRAAFVCAVPPVPAPFPSTATYWYEADALSRIYFVATLSSVQLADYDRQYQTAVDSWSRTLGAPVAFDRLPAGWEDSSVWPDSFRMRALLAGQASRGARWLGADVTIEVALRAEGGQPRLVASVIRGAPTSACDPPAVRDAVLDLFPPADEAARSAAARRLGACHVERSAGALRATLANDPAIAVRVGALRALAQIGHPPASRDLAALKRGAPPALASAARDLERELARPPVAAAAPASPSGTSPPAAAPTLPAPHAPPISRAPEAANNTGSATTQRAPVVTLAAPPGAAPPTGTTPPAGAQIGAGPSSPATAAPTAAPRSGAPLAIGASTVGGAILMRNLGLMGGQGLTDVTPQLLLGTAGAVIGFGTSWGLSRFGFRPTVEQAAWFANLTAWGTLAGLNAWGASGSSNPKLEYGALALGEVTGMGLGAFTAHETPWSASQIAMADGLLLGASLPFIGVPLINGEIPRPTTADAIGLPVVMTAAALAAHAMDPTANDLRLMTFGALAGAWTGGLLAAGATETDFLGGRPSAGGLMLGAGVGFLGAAALGTVSETDGERLGVAGAGLVAGNALGLGLHMTIAGFAHADDAGAMFTPSETTRWALGAGIGGVALGAAAYAYAPHLRLGPDATAMTMEGALYGAGTWWLALEAGASGPTTSVDQVRLGGGVLAGAVAGGLSGLVASRWFEPDGEAQATTAATTALGMAAGLGAARLATSDRGPGLPDFLGVAVGAGAGFAGGALTAHETRLRPPDFGAGVVGVGFGALLGTLAPTLGDASWDGGRTASGGAWLGAALGGAGMTAAAHLLDASGAEVEVATAGTALGLSVGFGAGLMLPCESDCTSRAPRIGAVAGIVGGAGLGLLGEWQLHLASGLGGDAGTLGALGAVYGAADGLLLAGGLESPGTTSREFEGGLVMASSAELGLGLLASRLGPLPADGGWVLTGGKLSGGLVGLGASMLARTSSNGGDALAALGGSFVGLGGAALADGYAPLVGADGGAIALGAATGGLLGTLAPTLGDDTWGAASSRARAGGLFLGSGLGAIGGAALRHGSDASPAALGLATLGAADGLATGLGVGLLAETGDGSTRAERIGTVAGTTAGLGVGALVWPRLALDDFAPRLALAAGAVGGWTGGWLPLLGHADASEVDGRRTGGGLLAGAGLGAGAALLLDPVLRSNPDLPDLVENALALDAVWTGAGAGVGALASTRDDAPVWGMLTAGTAGLVLGGALHDSIDVGADDAPLLTLATAEGLWAGGWLPHAIWPASSVTEREVWGGLAAGGFGGLGLAIAASSHLELAPATAGYAGFGSAVGAAIGGGLALVSPTLRDRTGVGILLGGTAVGLGTGAAMAPELALTSPATAAGAATLGGTLGAAESLLFAWSGRASDSTTYGGAALLGGGIGASLGLAAAAAPAERGGNLPAAAGFAAWGAWTGSFAGALVSNDAHDIVLGGLAGANVGFLTGYALLRTDAVDPRDFGWLSLFGALGTVAGAGVGAPFASRSAPEPVLAGLAVGPVAGMACGALLLPKLRRLSSRPSGVASRFRLVAPREIASYRLTLASEAPGTPPGDGLAAPPAERLSSDVIVDAGPSLAHRLREVIEISQWSPLIGALPIPDSIGPTPVLFGVTGLWK